MESLSDVVAGLMQKVERLDQLATSLMIKGLASITAFTAVFWTLRSLAAAVSAIGFTWLMVFLLYDFRLARKAIGSGVKMLKLNPRDPRTTGGAELAVGNCDGADVTEHEYSKVRSRTLPGLKANLESSPLWRTSERPQV